MRYPIAAGAALFIALNAMPAAASDYMGWYLGAGIGYGYPMATAPGSACTGKGGKIIHQKGKVFCTKPMNSEQGSVDPKHGNPGDLKVIRGQHTEFMWQGTVPKNTSAGATANDPRGATEKAQATHGSAPSGTGH